MTVPLNLPNLLSISRILITAPLIFFWYNQNYNLAVIFFVIAGLSDLLDGFAARLMNQLTPEGAWLDPLADKIFLNAIFFVLALDGQIPWFVFILIALRDLMLITCACYYYKQKKQTIGQANWLGKLSTLVQGLVIFVILTHAAKPMDLFEPILDILLILVVLITILSGFLYLSLWGKVLINHSG